MSNTYPTEERFKQLICEAFDELPGAESVRLEKIGHRLGKLAGCRKPSRSKTQHWLFWLLFGASLTAVAWWGGEKLFTLISSAPVAPVHSPATEPAASNHSKPPASADKQHLDPKQPIEQQDSPVIYRREQY